MKKLLLFLLLFYTGTNAITGTTLYWTVNLAGDTVTVAKMRYNYDSLKNWTSMSADTINKAVVHFNPSSLNHDSTVQYVNIDTLSLTLLRGNPSGDSITIIIGVIDSLTSDTIYSQLGAIDTLTGDTVYYQLGGIDTLTGDTVYYQLGKIDTLTADTIYSQLGEIDTLTTDTIFASLAQIDTLNADTIYTSLFGADSAGIAVLDVTETFSISEMELDGLLFNKEQLTLEGDSLIFSGNFGYVDVITEGAADHDTLSIISGGDLGAILIIRTFGDSLYVFDRVDGNTNLYLSDDFLMDGSRDMLMLFHWGITGRGIWSEISRSDNE